GNALVFIEKNHERINTLRLAKDSAYLVTNRFDYANRRLDVGMNGNPSTSLGFNLPDGRQVRLRKSEIECWDEGRPFDKLRVQFDYGTPWRTYLIDMGPTGFDSET